MRALQLFLQAVIAGHVDKAHTDADQSVAVVQQRDDLNIQVADFARRDIALDLAETNWSTMRGDFLDRRAQLYQPVGEFKVAEGAANIPRGEGKERPCLLIGQHQRAAQVYYHLGNRSR